MTCLKGLRVFMKEQDGGSSIELLLWFPVLVLMLTFSTDATLLMHQQQNLYNAARDASRQVALGHKTEEEVEELLAMQFDVDEFRASVVQETGFVTTTVSVPFSEYAIFSGLLSDGDLSADVTMWVENYESE